MASLRQCQILFAPPAQLLPEAWDSNLHCAQYLDLDAVSISYAAFAEGLTRVAAALLSANEQANSTDRCGSSPMVSLEAVLEDFLQEAILKVVD